MTRSDMLRREERYGDRRMPRFFGLAAEPAIFSDHKEMR